MHAAVINWQWHSCERLPEGWWVVNRTNLAGEVFKNEMLKCGRVEVDDVTQKQFVA